MSWYRQWASKIKNQQVTMTIIIPDMKNNKDWEIINRAIAGLPGIISVNNILNRRRIVVTYNLHQISLETIGQQLDKTGYRYVRKA